MPGKSHSKALATISEYASAAYHTHHGEFEWDSGPDGNPVSGYIFTDTYENTYRVYGPKDHSYMYVTYLFDGVGSLSGGLTEDEIQQYLDTPFASPKSEEEDESITATRAFLDSIDGDKMSDLEETILDHIDTPETKFGKVKTDNGSVRQFLVHRKILPYQDGFRARDFMDAVRYVTQAGTTAVNAYLDVVNSADITLYPDTEEMESQTNTAELDGHGRGIH